MSAFGSNIITTAVTDLIGFGATLNPDGSISAITGPTLRRVTAAPTQSDNAGSLALRNNGTLYITSGGGVWTAIGGFGAGWNLPDDVSGIWGTAAPGQVSSTYVSASNRWDLSGDSINQATAASGAALRVETGTNTITGAVAGNASGAIEMRTGATDSTNAGGTGGNSGALALSTGNASSTLGASGSSGSVTVTTGNSDDANSGSISLTTGTAGGTRGTIEMSALRIHTNDNIPFSVGTSTTLDAFEFSYQSGTTQGQIAGTDITAGGATQGTRNFSIATGTRTKNDANAGTPATGAISISSGQSVVAVVAGGVTGGVSGNVQIGTGATDSLLGANIGGDSGALGLSTGSCLSTLGSSGSSGLILMNTGDSADANTGNITIRSGNAASVGAVTSGTLGIATGTVAGVGTSGSVNITTGSVAGAGTSGSIALTPGTVAGGQRGQVSALGLRTTSSTAVAIAGVTTLALADSGGIFDVSQAAAYDIDLPNPTVGAGLDFLLFVGTPGANNVTVTVAGGAATFVGTIVNDITSVIPATGNTLTFVAGTAALGDNIAIRSISTTLYLVRAVTSTAGGITIA